MASVISAGTTTGTALAFSGDTSGALVLQTNGTTTAVTIDTSQNVGIGTSSPAYKLDVAGAISTNNNLTFTGTGNRITGDFSNATVANRVMFQTNVANSGTSVSTLASGTGAYSELILYSGSDTTLPVSEAKILSSSTEVAFRSTPRNGATALPMTFYTSSTERMRIDSSGNLMFNSGYGSAATAYGCRAWVNFNGTGTVAIRASGNVSSITDNGTGDYTVNFTTAMPDANYGVSSAIGSSTGSGLPAGFVQLNMSATEASVPPTTSALRFRIVNATYAALADVSYMYISILR